MPKSKRDTLVEGIRAQIKAMAPENCATIEEAFANAEKLADMGLCGQVSLADFVSCKSCGRPTWHGQCRVCNTNEEEHG